MHRLRFAPAGLLALLILMAACSSSGTSSSATASQSAAASSAAASESASESADASASDALPSIDLPNSDAELEALLPDEIGGEAAQKFSMRGDEFMATAGPEFTDLIARLDAQAEDVSVAGAGAPSGASALAFQVRGTDNAQLLDELASSLEDQGDVTGFEDATVGGKDVRRAAAGDEAQGSVYLYGVDDIVFFITTTDEDAAAEVLSDLP